MELNFRRATIKDCQTVFTAIQELQDKPLFTLFEFESYWGDLLSNELGKCDVWLAVKDEKVCAYVLANHFPIPRYLGIGIELEEVVTMPEYQRMGIGRTFIQFLIKQYSIENRFRKITVKTDDHTGSGRLYADLFSITDMKSYNIFLNKI